MLDEREREIIQAVIDDYDAACEAGYDEEKWAAFGGVEALRELLEKSDGTH